MAINSPLKKEYKGVAITCFFDGNFCRTGFFSADNIECQALKKKDFLATTTAVASLVKTFGFSSGGNYNVGVISFGLLSVAAIFKPV